MSFSIANLVKVKEIRNKILITLGLLLCYRIGFYVPLPGVDLNTFYQWDGSGGNSLFRLMGVLTGSNLSQPSLFSLGVMPYISASIIFSLLTKVVPSLERISKEGASGQRKINQYTRLATIPICLVQSLFIILGTIGPSMATGSPWLYAEVWQNYWALYVPVIMISLTAGTLFIMWLGEQITENGIGNGISLIIMAGIVSGLYPAFVQAFSGSEFSAEQWQTLLLFIGAWIVAVIAVVHVTKAQRRIPIQQAKQTRGKQVYGGQRHFLPLKVNSAGVMPIIFASALLIIPSFLGRAVGWTELEQSFSNQRGFWYVSMYAALIFFFQFFWTSLMFQPNDIANNLKEHGSFIPGIRPGTHTAEFLEQTMWRLSLAGGAFLALVAVFPSIVGSVPSLGNQVVLLYFMSGTSILIVVSVALDLVEKINAMLVMRNYEGSDNIPDPGSPTSSGAGTAGAGWGRRG